MGATFFALLLFVLILFPTQRAVADEYKLEYHCLGNAWESCFVYFEGTIQKGLAGKFKDMLANEGPLVYLNSKGGNLQEALDVGHLIRQSGKSTSIGSLDQISRNATSTPEKFPSQGVCESACAYMFMGGVGRQLQQGKLGVHRFYSSGRMLTSAEAQIVSGLLVEYLVVMGIDARFLIAASKSDASEMYYISDEEALEYSVVTPTGYGDLFLEPYLAGVVAAARRFDIAGPYDAVAQITFFCERDLPHVMLTAKAGFLEKAVPLNIRLDVSSVTRSVSLKHLTVRDAGDLSFITIEIPDDVDFQLDGLSVDISKDFYIDVVYPRVAGGVYGAKLNLSKMDRAKVVSAFRHCIR